MAFLTASLPSVAQRSARASQRGSSLNCTRIFSAKFTRALRTGILLQRGEHRGGDGHVILRERQQRLGRGAIEVVGGGLDEDRHHLRQRAGLQLCGLLEGVVASRLDVALKLHEELLELCGQARGARTRLEPVAREGVVRPERHAGERGRKQEPVANAGLHGPRPDVRVDVSRTLPPGDLLGLLQLRGHAVGLQLPVEEKLEVRRVQAFEHH